MFIQECTNAAQVMTDVIRRHKPFHLVKFSICIFQCPIKQLLLRRLPQLLPLVFGFTVELFPLSVHLIQYLLNLRRGIMSVADHLLAGTVQGVQSDLVLGDLGLEGLVFLQLWQQVCEVAVRLVGRQIILLVDPLRQLATAVRDVSNEQTVSLT